MTSMWKLSPKLLTGVEAGLLRVVDVSVAFDGGHDDDVAVACGQVVQAVAQIQTYVFPRHQCAAEGVTDIQAVVADARRPGQPGEKSTAGRHVAHRHTAEETICG